MQVPLSTAATLANLGLGTVAGQGVGDVVMMDSTSSLLNSNPLLSLTGSQGNSVLSEASNLVVV